jgi:hypothetical protein
MSVTVGFSFCVHHCQLSVTWFSEHYAVTYTENFTILFLIWSSRHYQTLRFVLYASLRILFMSISSIYLITLFLPIFLYYHSLCWILAFLMLYLLSRHYFLIVRWQVKLDCLVRAVSALGYQKIQYQNLSW